MNNVRCQSCGLINWAERSVCARCAASLEGTPEFHLPSERAEEPSRPRTLPILLGGFVVLVAGGLFVFLRPPQANATRVTPSATQSQVADSPATIVDAPVAKTRIVYYYADWCPTCSDWSPAMRSINEKRNDIVVEMVDIVDWDSPIAHQNSITSVPNFKIYSPEGALVASGSKPGFRWFQQNHPELMP